jgi:hypothetical protein
MLHADSRGDAGLFDPLDGRADDMGACPLVVDNGLLALPVSGERPASSALSG